MVAQHLSKLPSTASASLRDRYDDYTPQENVYLAKNHVELPTRRDDFYAFEQVLHALQGSRITPHMSLFHWHEPDTWLAFYGDVVRDHIFFVEDILGG